ncbi:MAG: tail fiber domain-containing protein [Chitinophagales bacterium]|nr:tail fiber domain-containing protein [Chitinophagales bacterium]
MRNLILSSIFMLFGVLAYAQSPQGIKYQAVARNSSGAILSNQNINIRASIIDSTGSGSVQYVETFKTGTNAYGLFDLKLGAGAVQFGSFSAITWASGNKWLKIELDPTGGTNFTEMGTSELLSVPYALFAGNAGAIDTSYSNELITSVTFDPLTDELTIVEGGLNHVTTINYRADDLADNILNDLQDVDVNPSAGQILKWDGTQWVAADDDVNNQSLAIINNQLVITDGNSVDLSPYLDNTDNQQLGFDAATNTLSLSNGGSVNLNDLAQDGYNLSFAFDQATNILTITDNGGSMNVDLTSLLNDPDADPANEFNATFSYDAATHVLTITDGGGSKTVDLTQLLNDGFNTGVAYDSATATLSITDNGGTLSIGLGSVTSAAYNTAFTFDSNTNLLSITDNGGTKTVDLTSLENDADADATNELNTVFSFNAATNELTITDAGGSHTVNLASVATGGYNTGFAFDPATNNLTITDNGAALTVNLDDVAADGYNTGLSFDPATFVLTITDRGTSYNVSLAPLNQTLSSSVTGTDVTVSISNGNSTTFSIADTDNDPTNEYNTSVTYDQATNVLTVNDAGGGKSVNLTGLVGNAYNTGMTFNTVTNILTITDGGTSYTVDLTSLLNDADANPTNEIQDLSLSGNTLTLSSDPTTVNLAPYLDNTDNQTLSLVGNSLSISNGNSVNLAQFTNTDNQTLSVSTSGSTVSIGITNGNTINFDNNDADSNPFNEIQTLSLVGNTLSISGSGGNSVNLPADLWTLTGVGNDIKRTVGDVYVGNAAGTNTNLYLSGSVTDWDNTAYTMDLDNTSRLNNVIANTVDFSPNVSNYPTADGILYRYQGQAEVMVDDNLYIRDNSGAVNLRFQSDNGWMDAKVFRDLDNVGYVADPSATSRLYNFDADLGTTRGRTFLNYYGDETFIGWAAGTPTYTVCNDCCTFDVFNWSCGIFSRQRYSDCGNCGSTTYHYLRMEVNGGARATAWFTTSDEKYKTNVASIPHALDIVQNLNGRTYDYNWNHEMDGKVNENPEMMRSSIGFIAQELQKVVPQVVQVVNDKDANGQETGTTTLAVQYDAIIPILVEAIKEQQKQIDDLKKQLATPKN